MCRLCLAEHEIERNELEVHHIVPLSEAFEKRLTDSNLITLCWMCHQKAHNDTTGAIREKLIKLARENPGNILR